MKLLATYPVKKMDLGFHGNLYGGRLLEWLDGALAAFQNMKQCIKCKKIKEITEYPLRPEGTLFNTCKECKRIYNRARHHEKSKDLQWRVQRSEVNKKYYQRKKHEQIKSSQD